MLKTDGIYRSYSETKDIRILSWFGYRFIDVHQVIPQLHSFFILSSDL